MKKNSRITTAHKQEQEILAQIPTTEGRVTATRKFAAEIKAATQEPFSGNPQPLNAIYVQIEPKALSNFLIGCNEIMVQERTG